MNKIWIICLCLILSAGLLVGCGETTDSSNAHLITPSGEAASIGEDGADIEGRFGTPEDYAQAQSCYGNGYDKVYTYAGFEITTYPSQDGTKETISVLALTNNTVQTGSGLKVGQDFAKAVEIYGDNYIERGTSYVYTLDADVTLWIDIEEDVITRIEFRAP